MKRFLIMSIFAGLCAIFGCSAKGFVSVDADEFAREIAKPKVQLVDVRTADEYAEGHIPNAVNIDVLSSDFAKKFSKLDKKHTVALYCRSGRRSKLASEALVKLGYTNIKEFGGIIDWPYEVEE